METLFVSEIGHQVHNNTTVRTVHFWLARFILEDETMS